MKKVFLGGTCNGSEWRENLIDMLKIDYFNPVVKDWNQEAYERELKERKECDFVLYVLTPKMTGLYSIAEVVDDSNKQPEKTIFCVLDIDYDDDEDEELEWSKHQRKSLTAISKMVVENGGSSFESLEEVADYLNGSI